MTQTADIERLVCYLYRDEQIEYMSPGGTPWPTNAGNLSPHYVDTRDVTGFAKSSPLSLDEQLAQRELVVTTFVDLLGQDAGNPSFDHVYGIPQAATPFAGIVGHELRKSVLWGRIGIKDHGKQSPVQGKFDHGDTVAAIDNVITLGGSAETEAEKLAKLGLQIVLLAVLIDREEGGPEILKASHPDIQVRSAIGMRAVTEILLSNGLITSAQAEKAAEYRRLLLAGGADDVFEQGANG